MVGGPRLKVKTSSASTDKSAGLAILAGHERSVAMEDRGAAHVPKLISTVLSSIYVGKSGHEESKPRSRDQNYDT